MLHAHKKPKRGYAEYLKQKEKKRHAISSYCLFVAWGSGGETCNNSAVAKCLHRAWQKHGYSLVRTDRCMQNPTQRGMTAVAVDPSGRAMTEHYNPPYAPACKTFTTSNKTHTSKYRYTHTQYIYTSVYIYKYIYIQGFAQGRGLTPPPPCSGERKGVHGGNDGRVDGVDRWCQGRERSRAESKRR